MRVGRLGASIRTEYVARFPEEKLSDAEIAREFLTELAWHLAKRIATGERHEAAWLFAALEPILLDADQDSWNALTVGFLESLIYSVEREGVDAAQLGDLATGPAGGQAWRAAFEYIHPPNEQASSPREV
jgi:hypothetical protein